MLYWKEMLYKASSVIVLSVAVLSFSGCESLPEGEPPQGPIVTIENSVDRPMSLETATNQIITALATSAELTMEKNSALPNVIPGPLTTPEDHKAQLAMLPISVYSELLTMGVIDIDPTKPANYILSSNFIKLIKPPDELKGKPAFKWEISLTKSGASKPTWSYFLKVYLDQ